MAISGYKLTNQRTRHLQIENGLEKKTLKVSGIWMTCHIEHWMNLLKPKMSYYDKVFISYLFQIDNYLPHSTCRQTQPEQSLQKNDGRSGIKTHNLLRRRFKCYPLCHGTIDIESWWVCSITLLCPTKQKKLLFAYYQCILKYFCLYCGHCVKPVLASVMIYKLNKLQ